MANPYATDKSAISRFAPFLDSILIERKSTAVDSTRPTPGLGTDRTRTNCLVTRWKTNPRAHFDDELSIGLWKRLVRNLQQHKYRADRLLNAERRGPAHGEFRHRCGRGWGCDIAGTSADSARRGGYCDFVASHARLTTFPCVFNLTCPKRPSSERNRYNIFCDTRARDN